MTRTIAGVLLALSLAGCATVQDAAPEGSGNTRVAVIGKQLYINGAASTLLGFRVGSAALLEPWTNELLAQLDEWKRHRVNAFTLWLQGSSGGYTTVFTANGSEVSESVADVIARTGYGLKESPAVVGRTSGTAVVDRAKRIVEAANQRGMVVVLGIIYRSALDKSDSEEVIRRAMQAAVRPFKDYPNVIFNVWNETDTSRSLERPEAVTRYVAAIRAAAPGRLVCAGASNLEMNLSLAALPGVDLVCQDAGRSYQEAVGAFEALRTLDKPVINVESYGGNGGGYIDVMAKGTPPPAGYVLDFSGNGGWRRIYGAWRDEDYRDATGRVLMGKKSYRGLMRFVAQDTSRQRHLLVHVGGWFQGASRTQRPEQLGNPRNPGKWNNVFHPGFQQGNGTPEQPGIRWILEEVAKLRSADR